MDKISHYLFILIVISNSFFCMAQEEDSDIRTESFKEFVYLDLPQRELKLYVHYPPQWTVNDARPAILFFSGNAWQSQAIDQFMLHCEYLSQRGIVAVRVDYRVGGRDKTSPVACVQDAKSAIAWLRTNAEAFGIDPNRIVAAGGSAGGHIAACAFTIPDRSEINSGTPLSSKPNYLVLFNPILNMDSQQLISYFGTKQMAVQFSPLLNLSPNTPPTLLVYGENDSLLRQGKAFLLRSHELGFPTNLFVAAKEEHGFFNQKPWLNNTLLLVDAFLRKHGLLMGEPKLLAHKYAELTEITAESLLEKKKEAPLGQEFQTTFTEYSPLSDIHSIATRMKVRLGLRQYPDHAYDIKDETFQVYIPTNYDPQNAYGLIVNISPGDKGGIWWKDLPAFLDEQKLIWVGANNSGNEHGVYERRIALALDAAYNIQQQYSIDKSRVYVCGVSGGGRASSMAAFHYPDVFIGGIFIIGVNYWETMKVPSQPDRVWTNGFSKPEPKYLNHAAQFGRYVFITGDHDSNREQMQTYYYRGYKRLLKHSVYIQVPDMGHEAPDVNWIKKALLFLDNPNIANEIKNQ